MKEFIYSNLEDYLAKADTYEDPKIIKMYEITTEEGAARLQLHMVSSVTYLRTALIGWDSKPINAIELDSIKETLSRHGHAEGHVVEVTGLRM